MTLVAVVMGSASDWSTMRASVAVLEDFGVPHEARVVSAHRMPDEMFEFAEGAAARGLRAIIAGAGGAAHLPGMLAAKTTVPVLGVPVPSRHLNGQDSLLSIVQMPAGVPVATFAIGEAGATNAALFAVALLAADDARLVRGPRRLPRRTPRRRGGGDPAALVTITPPATIGMLGGGQLGRYALIAARTMGYGTVVLDPDPAAPAGPRRRRARRRRLRRRRGTRPPRHDVRRRDDRVRESAGQGAGAAGRRRRRRAQSRALSRSPRTAWTRSASSPPPASRRRPSPASTPPAPDRRSATRRSSRRPAWATTARVNATSPDPSALDGAWRELGAVACVLERRVPLDAELSVIVARGADGAHAVFPVAENHHVDGHPRPDRRPCPRRSHAGGRGRRTGGEDRRRPGVRRRPRRRAVRQRGTSCWSTSSRRGRTTAVTGRSTRQRRASSTSRCAPSAAPSWPRRR